MEVSVTVDANVAPVAQHHKPRAISSKLLGLGEFLPLRCELLSLLRHLLEACARSLLLLAPYRRKLAAQL